MDVVVSHHEESSLNEHDFPTNDGLCLVHSGTFVFRIMCRGKHRDGAGIQRPPDSARLVVMARQTTKRTAGKDVFIVPESLLFIHVCCRPPPGSLPRLNVLPAAYQFIKFVAVCAQTFYWSWSVGSVILFSVSHSGCCQSYLPRYLSFDYPHSRSALKLQMRDWRGKNNFEFLFPASSYKCKSPDKPILMYIWWKWSFPWSACQIWLILQHLHNAIIFPP